MKVLGVNGSSRRDGNTAIMIERVFRSLEKNGIRCEMVQLAGEKINGCIACGACARNRNRKCAIDDDIVNPLIEKMARSDGMILGSPVYFSNITPELKALIDRSGRVAKANGYLFKRKVGAAVVAVRRAGAMPTFNDINFFFLVEQMIVPGSSYWNVGRGLDPGDVLEDDEGMRTMDDLGSNMAWILKKINENQN
jgi:multimeric flavodoxin WrbA